MQLHIGKKGFRFGHRVVESLELESSNMFFSFVEAALDADVGIETTEYPRNSKVLCSADFQNHHQDHQEDYQDQGGNHHLYGCIGIASSL